MRLPVGAVLHLCGPVPFLEAVRGALLERGVPASDVRCDVLGPDLWRADATDAPSPDTQGLAAAGQPA